jgi:uncharacterized protein YPO0396
MTSTPGDEALEADARKVREALADLHEEIAANYPVETLHYPTQRRRFERDTEELNAACEALERIVREALARRSAASGGE